MNLIAPDIAGMLAGLNDPRIYPVPIYYKSAKDAKQCGGRELIGQTVDYGLRHVSSYERSVLWVEGYVHELGRFAGPFPWTESHANVMIFEKSEKKVVVFEPTVKESCTHIDRVSLLLGGGTQREVFRRLRKRRSFTVSVCFGNQADTPTCREECWAFMQRMHARDFSLDGLELRELSF